MKKQRKYRFFINRKGVTLVELIVAMAVTLILIASLSSLMYPIQNLYVKSQSKIIMNNVGQKILDSLAVITAGSTKLIVYTETNPNISKSGDYKIYKNGDKIFQRQYGSSASDVDIIMANSYQKCKVVELNFYVDKVKEEKSFEDSTSSNYVRILKIEIKLSLRGSESKYMRTTVKLYNFSTSGAEIITKTGGNADTNETYKSVIITPYR